MSIDAYYKQFDVVSIDREQLVEVGNAINGLLDAADDLRETPEAERARAALKVINQVTKRH